MESQTRWYWLAGAAVWRVRPSAWALVAGGLISLVFSLLLDLKTDAALSYAERARFLVASGLLSAAAFGFGRLSVLLEEYRASGERTAFELAIRATNRRGKLLRTTLFSVTSTIGGFVLLFI